MIVSVEQLQALHTGKKQIVVLPFRRRRDGSLIPGPAIDALVVATRPRRKGKTCTVLATSKGDGGWTVTLAPGDVRDRARLMARMKGVSEPQAGTHDDGPRGYVLIDTGDPSDDALRGAIKDEPEVLDEGFQRTVARHAAIEQVAARAKREAVGNLKAAIAELEQQAPEERGRLQRLKATVRQLESAA